MFFPERLFLNEDFNIVRPETLGNKKLPADLDKLASFLRKECKDADGLILSVDTLLYGGLIPSRIHHETERNIAFPHGIDPGDQKRKSKYADLCVSGNYALSELFQQ